MKVLLINPTAKFEIIGNNPVALEQSRGHNPPLGLLYIAGYLRRNTSHVVSILDTQAEELEFSEISSRIRAFAPDVIGITVMTQTLIDVLHVVEAARSVAPEAKIVLGGPHVHLFPDESIRLPGIDYLVLGEGERSFAALLERMGDPSLAEIPGLVYRTGNEITRTGPPAFIENLDDLPFPARDLTDIQRYTSVLLPRQPVTTLFTSRGCPYSCSFCDRPHLGKRFRARSAVNVVDEIEQCVNLGIRDFLIYDDTFTVRRDRVVQFCEEMMRRRLDINFDIRARVDTVDPELLQLLANAGCRNIHYGVEAGTKKILQVLSKGIDLETVAMAFRATKKAGMQVLAYFMIGSPTETREDILETYRVIRTLDPDFLHLAVLTPFPGTKLYQHGLESGVFRRDVWREFAGNPQPGFIPPHWPENFTLDEINHLLVKGYRNFYRRPKYLLRRILKIQSFGHFWRQAKAGIRILTMRPRHEP